MKHLSLPTLCLAFVILAFSWSNAQAAEKPNIILIFTDDQGMGDVGCYGSEIPTPNIDRLAKEGMKFESWYSASSICTPSRYGLLTGKNPSRSKDQLLGALMFMAEEDKKRGLQEGEHTIAHVLRKEAGYHTSLIGKWHLGHGSEGLLPVNHGFDTFIGHTGGCIDFFTMTYGVIPDWYHQTKHVSENGYATELITEEAVSFLNSRKDEKQPFFLYLAYNAPHFGKGWSPSQQKPVNLMQPQAAELKRVDFIEDKIRREFAAMTVSLDDGVGKVLEALDKNELSKETLVIFLTDHGGDPVYGGFNGKFRGNKASLFEGGLRVPCLMRWPGVIKAESSVETPFWSLDLFPTFCSLAGADTKPWKPDGIDISAQLKGESKSSADDREFFWETGKHAELDRGTWQALKQGQWKYVRSPVDGEFLFNLEEDPFEKKNLAEESPEVFKRLKIRGKQLSEEYRE